MHPSPPSSLRSCVRFSPMHEEPSASRDDANRELFRTARTHVRRISARDEDAMLAVYGDAAAMTWVGDGRPLDREACRRWIDVTVRNYRERGYGMSAVELVRGDVIGFCGL